VIIAAGQALCSTRVSWHATGGLAPPASRFWLWAELCRCHRHTARATGTAIDVDAVVQSQLETGPPSTKPLVPSCLAMPCLALAWWRTQRDVGSESEGFRRKKKTAENGLLTGAGQGRCRDHVKTQYGTERCEWEALAVVLFFKLIN
jgi:hypothetical protein